MIYLGADHYGFQTKSWIMKWLDKQNRAYSTYGSTTEDDRCDIADIIPIVCEYVRSSPEHTGILICGTGVGMDIGANRFAGIRSVLAHDAQIAEWGKVYDNTNVLCLSGRDMEEEKVGAILTSWFSASFEDPEGRRSKRMRRMDTWS